MATNAIRLNESDPICNRNDTAWMQSILNRTKRTPEEIYGL